MAAENRTLFVQVSTEDHYPDSAELDDIRRSLQRGMPDYEFILSTDDVEIWELPALDDFADELADRVAERLE